VNTPVKKRFFYRSAESLGKGQQKSSGSKRKATGEEINVGTKEEGRGLLGRALAVKGERVRTC